MVVHAANIHDTMSGMIPLTVARQKYPTISGVCADAGYRGTFREAVESSGLKCDIAEKIKPKDVEEVARRAYVFLVFAFAKVVERL